VDDDTARREDILRALERKTAYEWNDDPRNRQKILGWSDFNGPGEPVISVNDLITWAEFEQRRSHCTVSFRLTTEERANLTRPRD